LAGLAAGKGKNMLSICQRKAKPLELAEKRVMKLEVCSLWIPDLKLISSSIRVDERGYFAETYVQDDFEAAGLHYNFVQDNQSGSQAPGTVRGLHFQVAPSAQVKLVRVLRGKIFDVAVDLRHNSPTYGRHAWIELDSISGRQLLVPHGFAHGFCALEPKTEVFYKVTKAYAPEHDCGVYWNDPALGIPWPTVASDANISGRDRALPKLADLPVYFE
jgi:dTDP-4-dehydrorhamnose 3,5-epimerase